MSKDTTKKRRFKLFDTQKVGRGVSKTERELEPGLKRFFMTYRNNLGKLLTVNIIMVVFNFPIFFAIIALAGYTQQNVFLPMSDLFQNVLGVFLADGGYTPFRMSLFALEGLQHQTLSPTVLTYVFYGISLLTVFTFGIVNAGTAYVLRNMASGEPVFVWADFCYAVKRNYKQALIFGIIDAAICIILGLNIFNLLGGTDSFFLSFIFWANIIIFITYFFMRYYMYVQMVTFDLSIFKMLKNSLIFSLLGIKRNLMAFLGIVILLAFEIFFLVGAGSLLIPFAVALPLILLLSTCAFMKVYASYFKIKQYMIDPYLAEHPEEAPVVYDDEPIMHDDVTERERLEEIKRKNGIETE